MTRYSPSRAFSGVMGSERTWWPVACATAEATAAVPLLPGEHVTVRVARYRVFPT